MLRLWPSHWQLREPAIPVWVGSVSELHFRRQLRLFTYLVNQDGDAALLRTLQREAGATFILESRHRETDQEEVLLARRR